MAFKIFVAFAIKDLAFKFIHSEKLI